MKSIFERFVWPCISVRLLAGVLSAFAWLAPQNTQAENLGKVMPMGDSITDGSNVAGGYRDPLYTLLNARGDTFTFVGSATDSTTAALIAAGQTHHEGHSGYVIAGGGGNTGLDEYLASWIGSGAESPDKILLMIGSNDINRGYEMPTAPTRLSDLITHIYSYRPSVKLYVASIIPMTGHETDVQTFNAAIPGIVSNHRALGHDVVYVPMFEALNSSTDLADGLHPNALGYQHMAQAWDTALHASSNLTVTVTSPANSQAFTVGATVYATATVANATGAYNVHVYTNSGSGAFAEAGTGSTSSPYAINLGALPVGTYHIYASVTDTLATSGTSTNTFTVRVPLTNVHAVDVMSAGDAPGFGDNFSVGWDFTVSQTIKVTALGQFDPDANPKANTVAIYQRGGAKLVEASVSASSASETSGIYSARYTAVSGTVLTPGNYVVFSTQNGDNFIAPGGNPAATFGSAITWNKGLALSPGSAAGPLPATAPANWPIENSSTFRYFGPTFKYDVVVPAPTLVLTNPTNTQTIAVGTSISATATVANATGDYTVHVYTNSGSAAYAEAGTGSSSSPYVVNLGALRGGIYHIYATVSDTLTSTNTMTNTFTVAVKSGQQILSLTGWNQDIIIGKTEAAPGYGPDMGGWNFYENGLSGGSQGLPADSGDTPRTFTASSNPIIQFQFAPYTNNNAVFLNGPGNATLTLDNPARFQSLQFLETTRTMSWYAKLNFADGSSTTTSTWNDPDWTANPGPADRCLTSYGLRNPSGGFYSGYLWMAMRTVTLSAIDQTKMLNSITFYTTSAMDHHLALFAVSGYALGAPASANPAVNLLSAGDGPGLGNSFSVGWDFTVSQTIKVTALGQFDPDSNPQNNTVAIYQRAGAKLAEVTVSTSSPSELSGNYSARYAPLSSVVLTPGNYVIVSTQNGDNFIAGGGAPSATFGPAVTWNKGVALSSGSSAGPLPATAPATWAVENASLWRYFGPTFKYELVVPPPTLTLVNPTNNQELAAADYISAVATVANAVDAYTVHVYVNSGSGAFAEAGTGGTTSPYSVNLGRLPAGTYHIYASVTDMLTTTNTATNTFTVAVKQGQQILSMTGWNQDIILGKSESSPGYTTTMADWNFYESGLSGGTQGLAADSGSAPRTFSSAHNPSVQFQFAPYTGNNAIFLQGAANATLTLVNPAKFQSLQFLETTRSMAWYAKLNFADGSSTNSSTWSDPDWTFSPPADTCLTSYGLRNSRDGTFYSGNLWMAERGFILSKTDRAKTLNSITFYTLGSSNQQLALFAVSGYALTGTNALEVLHAADVTTAGEGPSGGGAYSVGWDFTVTDTITVTALGQFDPDSNPQANTVALYQRGGAKLAEVTVAADASAEASGNYPARYAKIKKLELAPGNYVVFSTQGSENFIAGGGNPAATFGPAIVWNKGVALAWGSSAGPVPDTAPASWPIENSNIWRYFGPTFKFELGTDRPKGSILLFR